LGKCASLSGTDVSAGPSASGRVCLVAMVEPDGVDQDSLAPPLSGAGPSGPRVPSYRAFIIYSDDDESFVREFLVPALGLDPGRVLLCGDFTPGAPLIAEIERGVSTSAVTLAVLTPAYLRSPWARFTDEVASFASVTRGSVTIVPILLARCRVPLSLRSRVPVDFRDRAQWSAEASKLREFLHSVTDGAIPSLPPSMGTRASSASTGAPWWHVGLRTGGPWLLGAAAAVALIWTRRPQTLSVPRGAATARATASISLPEAAPDPRPLPDAQCVPSTKCNGTIPMSCRDGVWSAGHVIAGQCGAVCTPGSSRPQCTGQSPQVCDLGGMWQDGPPCNARSRCRDGVCVPIPSPSPTSPQPTTCIPPYYYDSAGQQHYKPECYLDAGAGRAVRP
jgi:hypothetical protein